MQEISGDLLVLMIMLFVLAGMLIPFIFLSFLYIRSENREQAKLQAELDAEANKGGYRRKVVDKSTGKDVSKDHE